MLRIEKCSEGQDAIVRLSGRIQSEHLRLLRVQIESCPQKPILNLEEVALVDRAVVRFLGGITEEVTKITGGGGLFSRDKALEMTQKYWVCSSEKARRVLGWEATIDPEQGFRETLAWYREQGLV